MCKGPEGGVRFMYSGNGKKVSVATVEYTSEGS